MSVKKANAHFSDDLLSTLLNEPIPGHGVFWSSAGGKSYPIPLRVLSFEQAYSIRDPEYKMPRAKTFAEELKEKFGKALADSRAAVPTDTPIVTTTTPTSSASSGLFADEEGGTPGAGSKSQEGARTAGNAEIHEGTWPARGSIR
jgi:hypothetical protein